MKLFASTLVAFAAITLPVVPRAVASDDGHRGTTVHRHHGHSLVEDRGHRAGSDDLRR